MNKIPEWELELNGHIEIGVAATLHEEYIPYLEAKRMIAEREATISALPLAQGWTQTPPTVDGYYFVWRKGWKKAAIDRVWVRDGEIDLSFFTGDKSNPSQMYTHWLGPLPETEPPAP